MNASPDKKLKSLIKQQFSLARERGSMAVSLGALIHRVLRAIRPREQSNVTWFLRNPILLSEIYEAINQFKQGETVRLCAVGCSTGAEIYSVLYSARKARPDLNIETVAIDISEWAIGRASAGRYKRSDPEMEDVSEESMRELFEMDGGALKIKPWISQGIRWILGDARSPRLRELIEQQDIVIANNFMIHMRTAEATGCFQNVAGLVRPGGLLVCWGMDVDVRERVALQLHLQPLSGRVEEMHNSAWRALSGWPWQYWGLEPLDKRRAHWDFRYAPLFRVPGLPVQH